VVAIDARAGSAVLTDRLDGPGTVRQLPVDGQYLGRVAPGAALSPSARTRKSKNASGLALMKRYGSGAG